MRILESSKDHLSVSVYDLRAEMGKAAAEKAAGLIRQTIAERGEANVIFAAAPSQTELLDALLEMEIDWSLVRGFQQDEYIGLKDKSTASFRHYLAQNIFERAPFKEVHYMHIPTLEDAEKECEAYAALLKKYPPDLIFLGFGENGHLAFNDPPVADFNDPYHVKTVELELRCRQQQVNDGCFSSLADVPTHAVTLTLPMIMSVPAAVVTVPGDRKADAVFAAMKGAIDPSCPASILRRHENAHLFLDRDSAAKAFVF